jgi:hypothetical protein
MLSNRDMQDRAAIEGVAEAVVELNTALRVAMDRKIRIEFGVVYSDGYGKKASQWNELWSEDGIATRFTREEIFAAPKPAPPVEDANPTIGGTP